MEKLKVLVGFKTPSRKFSVGAEVSPQDIDGALTFERLQELGHIEKPAAAKPTKSKD